MQAMLHLKQMYCSTFNRAKQRRKMVKSRGSISSAFHSDESPARPVLLLICQCGDQLVRAGPVGLQQKIVALINNLHKHISTQYYTVNYRHAAPWLSGLGPHTLLYMVLLFQVFKCFKYQVGRYRENFCGCPHHFDRLHVNACVLFKVTCQSHLELLSFLVCRQDLIWLVGPNNMSV